jgi:hypothetical protein
MVLLVERCPLRKAFRSMRLQTNASGGRWLQAAVSSGNSPSSGQITFLDSGSVVGTAAVNASGVAVLGLNGFASGMHALTASFGGSSRFAPSVSPVLREQWPSAGPGFSLKIASNEYVVASGSSLEVSAQPEGSFREPIALSCANGVPIGYACQFSPTVLNNGSGNSSFALVPTSKRASIYPRRPRWPAAPLFFGALFIWLYRNDRRGWCALVLTCCSAASLLSGCSGPSNRTQIAVLTVQASAGSGSQGIVQSLQLTVKLPVDR